MKILGLIALVFVFAIGSILTGGDRSAPPASVQAAHSAPHVTADEAAALIAACGSPLADATKNLPEQGEGYVERTLRYAQVEAVFGRDAHDPAWTMEGVFPVQSGEALGRQDAERKMSCLQKVQFSNQFF